MINQRKIAIYIDLIFCAVVLPLVLSIIPIERMFENARIFTSILVAYMYITYAAYRKVRVPGLIMQGRYVHAAVFVTAMFGLTWLLAHFPINDDFMMRLGDDASMVSANRRQRVWFLFLVLSGFSLVIDLMFELFKQMLARQEIEEAKNKAELALYKAQIDPHFMFNSLNAIYGMIVSGSQRTEEAFVKFSDILKYIYDSTGQDLVDMERELDYIGNYIDFQAMRYGSCTQVEWDRTIEDKGVKIPPMILITFVENAFKYGASSTKACRIGIRTSVAGGVLRFETENRVMRRPESGKKGIGIGNCRQRLELLYKDRYDLEMTEKEGVFRVRLSIEL